MTYASTLQVFCSSRTAFSTVIILSSLQSTTSPCSYSFGGVRIKLKYSQPFCVLFAKSASRPRAETSRWYHWHSPGVPLIINLNAVEGADNKELKRNSLAESAEKKKKKKKRRRRRRGMAWIIHLSNNQRRLPYLWAEKGPHSSARSALCLLRNAIAVHLKLKDSEALHTCTPTFPS